MLSRMRVGVPVFTIAALVTVALTFPVSADESPALDAKADALALGPVLPPAVPEDEPVPSSSRSRSSRGVGMTDARRLPRQNERCSPRYYNWSGREPNHPSRSAHSPSYR